MINKNFFIGLPTDFQGICSIYPPKIKDIVENKKFSQYHSMLTLAQEDIEDQFNEHGFEIDEMPSPLEFLLGNAYVSKEFEVLAREAFEFFIKEPVTFLYDKKIVLIGEVEHILLKAKKVEDLRLITAENFFDFQNLVRIAVGDKPAELPNPDEDPRIKRIKAKARYRDKIKAKQGLGISLEVSMAAICCMGIGINPLNIGELSYSSLKILMDYYQAKEHFETDVRSIMAGAKNVKPKYWIRDLDK